MKSFLFVFLGGGVGSCLRYLISVLWRSYRHHASLPDTLFPWPTLVANVLGCLLIGYFYAHAPAWHLKPETTLLLTTGLCGGFTTFSTFSNETLQLLLGGHTAVAVLYVVSSLLAGGVMVWAGLRL